jgi:hypothetical protein
MNVVATTFHRITAIPGFLGGNRCLGLDRHFDDSDTLPAPSAGRLARKNPAGGEHGTGVCRSGSIPVSDLGEDWTQPLFVLKNWEVL